jgi:hypothetical protein
MLRQVGSLCSSTKHQRSHHLGVEEDAEETVLRGEAKKAYKNGKNSLKQQIIAFPSSSYDRPIYRKMFSTSPFYNASS